jgi:hypothetical protein
MIRTGLAGLAALVLLAGCGGSPTPTAEPSPTPSPTPTAFAVSGTVEATAADLFKPGTTKLLPQGSPCVSNEGYDDIAVGSQVEVLDETNTTVALTDLGAGTLDVTSCVFPFQVDVPMGHPFYAFQVGGDQRGTVKFTADDLADGTVGLKVG